MAAKKTPAWVWIGCGCLLCVALVVAGIGGVGFFGFNMFKSMVEDMADPLARAEATMNLLGAETLPEGWYSHAFFRIPFVMEIAILTDGDHEPAAIEGSFEEKAEAMENLVLRHDMLGTNTFLYMHFRGRDDEPLEDLMSGRGRGRSGSNVDLDIELEPSEELGSGQFQAGEQDIEWRALRGTLGTVGGSAEGIYSLIRIVCPDKEKHDAMWFQRSEAAEDAEVGSVAKAAAATASEAAAEVEATAVEAAEVEAAEVELEATDLEGTPADAAALEWLFGYFNVC